MKYRHAYCYETSGVEFNTQSVSANAYVEEILVWNDTKPATISETATARLAVLQVDHDATVRTMTVYLVLLVISLTSAMFTDYWIIAFAFLLPLSLRYLGHYLTIKIAIARASTPEWHLKK